MEDKVEENNFIDFSEEDLSSFYTLEGMAKINYSYPVNTIIFTNNECELKISWDETGFKFEYPPDKMDEAGKQFFEWLKTYINSNYKLVPISEDKK